MIRPFLLLLAVLGSAALGSAASAQGAGGGAVGPSEPLAVVLEAYGQARVLAHSGGALYAEPDTLAAAPLLAVSPRDRVVTGPDGHVALAFADFIRLRIGASTGTDFVGQYDHRGYTSREVRVDSGSVGYTFEPNAAAPLSFTKHRGDGQARVLEGAGAILADSASFRVVVLDGSAEVMGGEPETLLLVAAGSVGVVDAGGVRVRASTLAERDAAAEPTERRRRLLIPGTDEEGNARTFIIEWDD